VRLRPGPVADLADGEPGAPVATASRAPADVSHELPTKMATCAPGMFFSPVVSIMPATPEKSFAFAPELQRRYMAGSVWVLPPPN
jgi:hypothetical protein